MVVNTLVWKFVTSNQAAWMFKSSNVCQSVWDFHVQRLSKNWISLMILHIFENVRWLSKSEQVIRTLTFSACYFLSLFHRSCKLALKTSMVYVSTSIFTITCEFCSFLISFKKFLWIKFIRFSLPFACWERSWPWSSAGPHCRCSYWGRSGRCRGTGSAAG